MSIVPKDQIQDEPSFDSIHPRKQRRKDPLIGRTINGRFTILEVIARGGMGKVYKAEQAPLGRLCAVKVLNPKYDGDEDPEFQKRFFLEASTAAKLSHANTVTIFDYGRDGDIYYIAMELIRGRTLYRVLRDDGPLAEDRVAHILRQVGRSLREAHALGVIHRDMKPANVVLLRSESDEADTVKVLDFGLVKHVDKNEAEDLTQQGLFMGSPKYMAPEQILGNPVSPRTDIYSLGVVAYELLTGSVPFDKGASVKTLMAHVNEPPPPMHQVNREVAITPAMHRIVMRCLEKNPEDRFQSIDELLRELTQVEGGGSLTDSLLSAPAVRPPPSTSGAHRRPSVPSLAAEPHAFEDGSGAHTRPLSLRSPNARGDYPDVGPRSQHPSATPLPMAHADLDDADLTPRSNTAIHVGLAAVAVAAIGGLAFAVTSGGDTETAAPAAPPNVTTAAATTTATSTATPSAVAPLVRTVRVTSKPSGAEVRENDTVVCGATPCDVTWRDAEAEREHTLRFIKRGFVTVDQTVPRDATSHDAELERVATPTRPSPPQPPPAPAPSAQPTAQPKAEPKGKGLSGYKDSPY